VPVEYFVFFGCNLNIGGWLGRNFVASAPWGGYRGHGWRCSNTPISYEIDANTDEARAMRRNIVLANEIKCERIIIQPDCLQFIETIQSGVFLSMTAAAIYDDIYVQCSTFSLCEFSFCNREANFVADRLSRETDSNPNVFGVDDPPSF
jgi:hypothetical protein